MTRKHDYQPQFGEKHEMLDQIIEKMHERSTMNSDHSEVDCWLTGKDADLEPWGEQGLQFLHTNIIRGKYTVTVRLHLHKTVIGHGVCINNDACTLGEYMAQASRLCCGTPYNSEWDTEDWHIFRTKDITIDIPFEQDDWTVDADELWDRIEQETHDTIHDWEVEIGRIDKELNELTGWDSIYETKGE